MPAYKNIAVILAGGSGTRVGREKPKQLLLLAKKTVLEHSIEAFEKHPQIDEIVVVAHADCMEALRNILKKRKYTKVRQVLAGGKERYDSTMAALRAFQEVREPRAAKYNLIFHDAARPLVSQRIITDVCSALEQHRAVAVAVPCRDTVFKVSGAAIRQVPDRSALMCAQTPQAFRLPVIRRAYDLAYSKGILQQGAAFPTDDCGIVLRYLPETTIHIVAGDARNMKLTYASDMPILESLYAQGEDNTPLPALPGTVAMAFSSEGQGE